MSAGQAAAGRRLGWTARRKRGRRIAGAPGRVLAALPPRVRRWLLTAAAVTLVVAAGYQFWLRDSSLVAVENVTVTGLTTKDAERVRASLVSAAHTMTTLHVQKNELEESIAAYPVVRAIEVKPDFPHGLNIHVVEHQPAGLVNGVPVAGDGTILRGLPVDGKLPAIEARGDVQGNHLKDSSALHAARVAGGAPAPLRPRLERIELRSGDGIVVEMRDGPEIIFGDATRIRAKWIAATRVLADPDAEGATYIDVRLPGRPAAGGLPAATLAPVAPAGTEPTSPQPTGTAPDATTVDPATEQPAPPESTPQTAPTEPQSAPAPAPESPAPAPAPTDSTGAGGASPPPG